METHTQTILLKFVLSLFLVKNWIVGKCINLVYFNFEIRMRMLKRKAALSKSPIKNILKFLFLKKKTNLFYNDFLNKMLCMRNEFLICVCRNSKFT